MRFLSLGIQTLNPGSSFPLQLITVSPRAPAAPEAARALQAPEAVPRSISGGRCPPEPIRFLCIFDFKKLSVRARFGLKKLSVWARFGGFLSYWRPVQTSRSNQSDQGVEPNLMETSRATAEKHGCDMDFVRSLDRSGCGRATLRNTENSPPVLP